MRWYYVIICQYIDLIEISFPLCLILFLLRKVDYCSNLIFQNENEFFHHSIETDIDGNIWVPSHMFPKSLSVKKVGNQPANAGGYFDDSIVKLSSNGV